MVGVEAEGKQTRTGPFDYDLSCSIRRAGAV